MICTNCEAEIPDESKVCPECSSPLTEELTETVEEQPVEVPAEVLEEETPVKKKKRIGLVLAIVGGVLALGTTLAILIFTHVICIKHDYFSATCKYPKTCMYCEKTKGDPLPHSWADATCTKAKTCTDCDETEGEALGHNWEEATCTSAKECKVCSKTEGDPLPHTEGSWKTTKTATLIDYGKESLSCVDCGKVIDTRTTSKKTPKASGTSFNFTDKEFIEWFNDISTITISSVDISDGDLGDNTAYAVTYYDGTMGAVIMNHGDNGKKGNICAMMFWFEEIANSQVIVGLIGEELDSSFIASDAFIKFVYDKAYTGGKITATDLDLGDDIIVMMIAPTLYYEDILV